MRLVFSEAAKADLIRIGDRIALESPMRAITFIDEIEAKCRRIPDFPLSCPLLPRRKSSGIRRMVHGNYLIFYRVDADAVIVVHVLHGAMNYEAILFPEF